jgi:hypothetical protein
MGGFIEWWAGQSTGLKVGVALLLLSVSTGLWWSGRFWPWGWIAGVILLLLSFPSKARRKGYHGF